jgi:benzylsuccinate CoA-transferase BbsE subunit
VVEFASRHLALAGKLMADLGAEVILVEPQGGHASRWRGPFIANEGGADRSLPWLYFNTSKRGVSIDAESPAGREALRELLDRADIVLDPGNAPFDPNGICGYHETTRRTPSVIWVSLTEFGFGSPPRTADPIDLLVAARSGPVWSCGYDGYDAPPVRPAGGQSLQVAAVWAVNGALVALHERRKSKLGQLVDVSITAASNVTTEAGSYQYFADGRLLHRQRGRHATPRPTAEILITAADGREVCPFVSARSRRELAALADWLAELGLLDDFPERFFLEAGAGRNETDLDVSDELVATEIFSAGRAAISFIAAHLPGYEFFLGAQARELAAAVAYWPEEVAHDQHLNEREFMVSVEHENLGLAITYPGPPYRMSETPWQLQRRAPQVGEHNTLLKTGDA